MKTLIVLSSGFPFDEKEPFLETELGFLSTQVDRIVVLPTDTLKGENLRPLPHNCSYLEGDFNAQKFSKGSLIAGLFRKEFWKEIRELRRNSHFSFSVGAVKTALVSLVRSRKMLKLLEANILLSDQPVFYSFWADDAGISLALLKKKHPELKCFVRAHGWDIYFHTNTLNYLPYRWLLTKYLDGIICISESGANYIRENWSGGKASNLKVLRLGVPLPMQVPEKKDEVFTLVSCSYLAPVKRVHLIAEALNLVKHHPIKWIHFGGGEQLNALKELTGKNTSPNMEIELKGDVSNEEILNWYGEHYVDLFLNVSESEGIPVSIMEAMSFGIPVLATKVGGTPELVNDKNGVLVNAAISAQELADKITEIVEDETRLLEMRTFALAAVAEKFNAEKNYSQLFDYLFSTELSS